MPYDARLTAAAVIDTLESLSRQGQLTASSTELALATGASLPAVKRMLMRLVDEAKVSVTGKARATRYSLPAGAVGAPVVAASGEAAPKVRSPSPLSPPHAPWSGSGTLLGLGYPRGGPFHPSVAQEPPAPYRAGLPIAEANEVLWSANSLALQQHLAKPLMSRMPVDYRRELVDAYIPNQTFLLPQALAEELANLGQLPDQQAAGTYITKVMELLLIDLSWTSSYLEGNSYTRLDTEKLFNSREETEDPDAIMLLNHKAAIEFMVAEGSRQGLTHSLIFNMHTLLMKDLLRDRRALGTIREKVVGITSTTHMPLQVPAVLTEMFGLILEKAQLIRNPVEAAFFLWVQLAYLQAFVDGNKRVSRLAANVPLMLYNLAPLSFLDVTREDYAQAMLGVYECNDMAMAIDLFEWTYRRSQPKYRAALAIMSAPQRFRIKYRVEISEAVQFVVRDREPASRTGSLLRIPAEDAAAFQGLLNEELEILSTFNRARFRLGEAETAAWIAAGRPQ